MLHLTTLLNFTHITNFMQLVQGYSRRSCLFDVDRVRAHVWLLFLNVHFIFQCVSRSIMCVVINITSNNVFLCLGFVSVHSQLCVCVHVVFVNQGRCLFNVLCVRTNPNTNCVNVGVQCGVVGVWYSVVQALCLV